jgi:hypothetical protein
MRQRISQQEHERAKSLEREAAEHTQAIQLQAHRLAIIHERERASEQDATLRNTAMLEEQLADRKRAREVEHRRTLDQEQLQFVQQENQLQLKHRESMLTTEKRALESRYDVERRHREEAEQASKRHHDREMTRYREERSNIYARQRMIESHGGAAFLTGGARKAIASSPYDDPD